MSPCRKKTKTQVWCLMGYVLASSLQRFHQLYYTSISEGEAFTGAKLTDRQNFYCTRIQEHITYYLPVLLDCTPRLFFFISFVFLIQASIRSPQSSHQMLISCNLLSFLPFYFSICFSKFLYALTRYTF